MADIPVAPTGPTPSPNLGTNTSSSTGGGSPSSSSSGSSGGRGRSGSSSRGGRGGSSGGSGSGGDPYGYRKKAADRYEEQAKNLQAQAAALQKALRTEFKGALRTRLGNVNRILKEQDSLMVEGYRDRVSQLAGANQDNNIAAAGQTNAAQSNRVRERNSALSEATMQGAGESDMLQSQLMSLRNWNAGQNEVNRSQFDTLRSINSSLTDLNVDTKTGRVNLATQALADRELLYQNYYDRRSETLTQLGNVYGQMADYYSMAQEYGGGGPIKKLRGKMRNAYGAAADASGEAWDNRGGDGMDGLGGGKKKGRGKGKATASFDGPITLGGGRPTTAAEPVDLNAQPGRKPSRAEREEKALLGPLSDWEGRGQFKTRNNSSMLQSMPTVRLDRKPEGATLRSWDDE